MKFDLNWFEFKWIEFQLKRNGMEISRESIENRLMNIVLEKKKVKMQFQKDAFPCPCEGIII